MTNKDQKTVARCIDNKTALRHPISGQYVAYRLNEEIPADDVIVKAFPWAFEIVAASASSERVETTRNTPGDPRDVRQ